jgi:hypothetical protein
MENNKINYLHKYEKYKNKYEITKNEMSGGLGGMNLGPSNNNRSKPQENPKVSQFRKDLKNSFIPDNIATIDYIRSQLDSLYYWALYTKPELLNLDEYNFDNISIDTSKLTISPDTFNWSNLREEIINLFKKSRTIDKIPDDVIKITPPFKNRYTDNNLKIWNFINRHILNEITQFLMKLNFHFANADADADMTESCFKELRQYKWNISNIKDSLEKTNQGMRKHLTSS